MSVEKDLEFAVWELTLRGIAAGNGDVYGDILKIINRGTTEAALHRFKENQVQAANALGVNRNTLRTRLKEARGTAQCQKRKPQDLTRSNPTNAAHALM